jgi:hypothetical protein
VDRTEDGRRARLAQRVRRLRRVWRAIALALLAGAVVQELRTPAEQRQWHGTLGFVPYDLRRPTTSKLRAAMWAPENRHLLVPRAFGVGWTVNLGRLTALARRR